IAIRTPGPPTPATASIGSKDRGRKEPQFVGAKPACGLGLHRSFHNRKGGIAPLAGDFQREFIARSVLATFRSFPEAGFLFVAASGGGNDGSAFRERKKPAKVFCGSNSKGWTARAILTRICDRSD